MSFLSKVFGRSSQPAPAKPAAASAQPESGTLLPDNRDNRANLVFEFASPPDPDDAKVMDVVRQLFRRFEIRHPNRVRRTPNVRVTNVENIGWRIMLDFTVYFTSSDDLLQMQATFNNAIRELGLGH